MFFDSPMKRRPADSEAGGVKCMTARALGVVAVTLLAALSAPAVAAPADDIIAEVDESVLQLEDRTKGLERGLGPGGVIGGEEALKRFQDGMFQHLIGDHEPAAEGFFALVTTGALADAGLHRDAEWYLAESLLGMRNYQTAAERFQVVADDASHPFRDDAVRRLLELYAQSGDVDAFRALYDAEIRSGKVTPTPEITYSLGKAFYQQGDRSTAASTFAEVPPGSEWHAKSLYFLGVIAVVDERLDDAKTFFQQTADLSIESADGRRVHDLALLALGRIAYESGEFLQAAESYSLIGADSEYQADKLYEVIWTAIKQKRYADALNNIEIFLLAFPEHRYSAQLMLNQGHLSYQQEDWSGALTSYEQVIVAYEPVRSRFAVLASNNADQRAAVEAVLDASRPEIEGGLPTYAVAMMRADPELSRAIGVFQDLDQQRRDIEASERLIQELQGVVTGGGGIGSLERVRYDAVRTQTAVLSERMRLLEADEAYLNGTGDEGAKLLVSDLAKRRRDLAAEIAQGSSSVDSYEQRLVAYETRLSELQTTSLELQTTMEEAEDGIRELQRQLRENDALSGSARASIEEDIAALQGDIDASRSDLSNVDDQVAALKVPSVVGAMASTGFEPSEVWNRAKALARDYAAARPTSRDLTTDRLDGLHITLTRMFDRLTNVLDAAIATETSELGRIKKRFDTEVEAVAVQRTDYTAQMADASDVSLVLTRQGFGRLEDFFSESVLKADMGIVDVYWAQKTEVADEIKRVKEEKDVLLAELQQRFKLIRQKIGEEP